MKRRIVHGAGLIVLSIIALPLFSQSLSKLEISSTEMNGLLSGGMIVRTHKIDNRPWPEITIFTMINANPYDSTAIFTAYHTHKEFIPDLIRSEPVKTISPTDIHVAFEMNIPWPLSNSRYVTGNRLSKFRNMGYKVEWYHVSSNSSRNCYGMVWFIPYQGKTLLKYMNFTWPKSRLARLFTARMIKKTIKAVKAIKKRVEFIVEDHQALLNEYCSILDEIRIPESEYTDK